MSAEPFGTRVVELLAESEMTRVDKPWGHEIMIANDAFILKYIVIKAGHSTSLQYHNFKDETTVIVDNHGESGQRELVGRRINYDGPMRVRPSATHRVHGPVTMVEVTTPENDDIVRLQDEYGRSS